jgi:N-acetylglucosaminyldiphosphoundecaprenol N-acetyl-beta-D-mannosaminyltransferase
MQEFCNATGPKCLHFFYAGNPGVADLIGGVLESRFGISLVGSYSPPFRPLSEEEDEEVVSLINAANPDVLWIGLSTPKQERWMHEHRTKLRVPVEVGVGAAFDINSGRSRQAPRWMRDHGLGWSFRLLQEPRRLGRRYLIYGSDFLCSVALELLSLRRFD